MTIETPDIKRLWGLAAGRCSYPDCPVSCVQYVGTANPTVVGEMAHVIARSPDGPRGTAGGGSDEYANLILLCPTHHRFVDKAPQGTFPVEVLLDWKKKHETSVVEALEQPKVDTSKTLFRRISYLLAENYEIWRKFGPESSEAKENPFSSASQIWAIRKIAMIVPNNQKIISLIKSNKDLLSPQEYAVCCEFIEHAEAFAANAIDRREGSPRFPISFRNLVESYE